MSMTSGVVESGVTYSSYHKPKSFYHVVSTAEAGSGIVNIPWVTTPTIPTDSVVALAQVKTAANVDKTNGLTVSYAEATGYLSISGVLTAGDKINAMISPLAILFV